MNRKKNKKFLGISLIIWKLQLLYVAVALFLYVILFYFLFLIPIHTLDKTIFNISYVLLIIILNIIWRVLIDKKFPNWR